MILRNVTLFDGSGRRRFTGDLSIAGDRIAAIGALPPGPGEAIDCTGLAAAPGFIDAHSHSDLQVLERRPEKVRQGVTAEVVGNCGFSPYPMSDGAALRNFANGIFRGDDRWGWRSAGEYLAAIEASRPTATVVSLVGHGSLRIAVAGTRHGALDSQDVSGMESLLEESFDQGAGGFSTGLAYAPGESAPFEELERLCRVVAKCGKVYATHMRTYFSGLLDAIDEQIELARRTGCRLQISHLQAAGAANWKLQEPALERIEKAHAEGMDVAFDCYPYIAGSTVLTLFLPQWALDGGTEAMLARLRDRGDRTKIAAQMVASSPWPWEHIFISAVGSERNKWVIGKHLAAIGEERGVDPVDAALDLLLDENGDVNMLVFSQSDQNLRQTLTHPMSLIITDGFYVKGRPHPRLHGTFPFLLGTVCRERGWMSLEEAIRKVTSAPAERFGIEKRGKLEPGYFADITVFDPERVGSAADYDNPEVPPTGIRYVFRNGELIFEG